MIALLSFQAAPLAGAVPPPPVADATKAANYLVKNLPSAKEDVGLAATTALGLATTADCTYAPSIRTLVAGLESQARKYTKDQPARAAKLAITVSALGLNPRNFGGVNLVSAITKKLPADGRIGSYESAFSQSLAILALKRAGATIPVTLLTKLLSEQDSTGAFGYDSGGFVADWDTTALSILALHELGSLDPQVTGAISAAEGAQLEAGYWDTFSPVDTTSLMGSALKVAGENVDEAAAWLATQQLTDGGFPAALGGGSSDVMATSEAMFLATGKTAANATLKLRGCPSPKRLPASVTSCAGVWVVVDRGNGQDAVRCATKYSTGNAALKSAGFSTQFEANGILDRINGFPVVLVPWPDETRYWTYWHATQNSDGTWGDWQSYNVGGATSTPVKGEAEGWYWANYSADPSRAFPFPPKGYSASPDPLITGTPQVGQTLTVDPGTWTPAPEKVSIRWYRGSSAIKGATGTTHVLVKADLNRVITVKVTASKGGYQTVTKTSLPTAQVTK